MRRLLTPGGTAVPVVVIVGCSPEFVARCRAVARDLLALVLDCDLSTLRASASSAPCLILVKKSVCDANAQAFRAFAEQVHAEVVTLADESASRPAIESAFSKAIRASEQRRSRAPS
jgi:hypothetical protein